MFSAARSFAAAASHASSALPVFGATGQARVSIEPTPDATRSIIEDAPGWSAILTGVPFTAALTALYASAGRLSVPEIQSTFAATCAAASRPAAAGSDASNSQRPGLAP